MISGQNLLMVADTEHDANMLYAVGMFVPDPFIYLQVNGKPQTKWLKPQVLAGRK